VVLAVREDRLSWTRSACAAQPALDAALRPPVLIQVNALEGSELQRAIEQQVGWGHAVLAPPALAARLLGRRDGGASALIGMVQRAASPSLRENDAVLDSFQKVLENAVTGLMTGYPVGAAMDFFNQYHVELAAELHALRESDDTSPEHARYVALVAAAARDARSFVVIGDPAARIPFLF
jgi:hypothetical protein